MFFRKSTVVMLVVLAMGMLIASASYAEKHLDCVGSKGVDGADNVKQVEDGIIGQDNANPGSRGADMGFVTEVQHAKINGYIAGVFNVKGADNFAAHHVLSQAYSNISVYSVPDLYQNTGVRGHYGIRRNAIYVDDALSDEQKALIANHEAYELTELRKLFLDGNTERGELDIISWINHPDNRVDAKEMLQKIHDDNPYKLDKLGNSFSSFAPGHMILPGIRGAAGLAGIEDILVSNEADVVLTKNNFFETNVDDAKIITVTADAIISGALDVKDIYDLASQNQVSIAVLTASEAQVDGVTRKFSEAGLSINDLIDRTQIAFVLIKDSVITAVNQMLKDNQGLLINCTLSNLNAKYAETIGGQV